MILILLLRSRSVLIVAWLCIVEYVQRFATKEAADNAAGGEEEEPEAEMSDIGSISGDEDMET